MQLLRTSIITASAVLLSLGVALAQDKASGAKAKAEVGKPAPEFTLKDTTGKDVKLSDFKDKIVVLEWENKDCPYSNDNAKTGNLPKMLAAQKQFADKGVVWLAIDSTWGHKADDVNKYRTDKKIPYPILLDADGSVGRNYGATNTPHIFIINKGTLVYAGAHDNGREAKESGAAPRNYVVEVVEAVSAGKPAPLTTTKPYGCTVKYKGNE